MATLKRLDVRPSAGNGVDPLDMPAELTDFCAALEDADPQTVETTLDPVYDSTQVHQCALEKSEQVDPGDYGLTVNWQSYILHAIDPIDPRIWSDDVNLRSVLYTATATGGATWYFCVCPL
jgi:hypothetical protein